MLSIENFRKYVAFVALATFSIIVLGGAIRVFDAGMSCPDWPMCYGLLIPFPEPEGGYVVDGRLYTWWEVALEWVHRLIAAVVGFLMLIMVAWATKLREQTKKPFYFTLISLLLLASQVKLGAVTVWFNNIHWSVAIHLGNALLFWASLILVRRVSYPSENKVPAPLFVKSLIVAYAVVVFFTILVGGMVSSSHSGGVCGGLFSCLGSWLPEDFGQLMHMKHRFMVLLAIILFATLRFSTLKSHPRLKKSMVGLDIIFTGQIILGLLTLYSFAHYADFYRVLSVAHLAWGSILWMACVGVMCNVFYGVTGSFHDRNAQK